MKTLAKSISRGKLFDMCAADADETGAAPVYLSRDGRAVRVNRDGSTTLVGQVDQSFRSRMLSSLQVACSSPSVRRVDVAIPRVPPDVTFEARYHNSTVLRLEEVSRSVSTRADGDSENAVAGEQEVHVRVHLPGCSVGVAHIEAVWSSGPCRNMPCGAGRRSRPSIFKHTHTFSLSNLGFDRGENEYAALMIGFLKDETDELRRELNVVCE